MSDPVHHQFRPTDPVGRILYVITRTLAIFGGIVFTAIALMMTFSVLGRWLISAPIKGDFELLELGAGIAVFACLPYCQLMRENIVVDFFLQNASKHTRAAYDSVAYLLFTLVIALSAWRTAVGGFDMNANNERTTMLEIPLWATFPWAVSCLVLLFVVCGYTFVRSVGEARPGSAG